MHKYYQAGYIPTEAATLESIFGRAGDWQMVRRPSDDAAVRRQLWSTSYGYPVVSTPMSDALIYNWSVMGSMQAISANSKHPEKAMEFLNLLNTDPVLRNMVDSGIEGVHYKKTDGDYMENLPESKNYDMPTFSLGNIMLTYLNPAIRRQMGTVQEIQRCRQTSPHCSASTSIRRKYRTRSRPLQNVERSFWAPLMTGTVDPDKYLPKAIKKLKDAGLG